MLSIIIIKPRFNLKNNNNHNTSYPFPGDRTEGALVGRLNKKGSQNAKKNDKNGLCGG